MCIVFEVDIGLDVVGCIIVIEGRSQALDHYLSGGI